MKNSINLRCGGLALLAAFSLLVPAAYGRGGGGGGGGGGGRSFSGGSNFSGGNNISNNAVRSTGNNFKVQQNFSQTFQQNLSNGVAKNQGQNQLRTKQLDAPKLNTQILQGGTGQNQLRTKQLDSPKLNTQILQGGTQQQFRGPTNTSIGKNNQQIQGLVGKNQPNLNLNKVSLKTSEFGKLGQTQTFKNLKLDQQFKLHHQGDIARQLNLAHDFGKVQGKLNPNFLKTGLTTPYCGKHQNCCMPKWSGWMSWAFLFQCNPLFDPRPSFCQPIGCQPCPIWTWWDVPVWGPLPVCDCGTWIDAPLVRIEEGIDLQLLAVRFVDSGHPEEKLGPRYRVWVRNNSPVPVGEFNVVMLAGIDPKLVDSLPQSGARILGMKPGEIHPIDIRLPVSVMAMGHLPSGEPAPFTHMHVIVDADREMPEVYEENNGAMLLTADILPVDPVTFSAESTDELTHLAGEGFGPAPGKVTVHVNDLEMEAEVVGWHDLGIEIRLPEMTLEAATAAEILVIRGDGVAANPLALQLGPPS